MIISIKNGTFLFNLVIIYHPPIKDYATFDEFSNFLVDIDISNSSILCDLNFHYCSYLSLHT